MAVSRLNLGTTNQVLVKAASGQTSNILEAQNSSGSVVAGLSQSGVWSGSAAPGLVLLNTTSFSAVSSQSINDVFSTTYDNYKILLNIDPTGSGALTMRLRVSGSDNSSNNYMWFGYTGESNTVFLGATGSSGAVSSFRMGSGYGQTTTIALEVANPFRSQHTQFKSKLSAYSSTQGWCVDDSRSGTTTVTTSYTGFSFFTDTSTISGSVSTYGYNK